MKKKLLALLLAALLAAGLLPGTALAAERFSDVVPGAYYYDAVNWAVDSGITNGTGNNQFSPKTLCTEGEILTFLYRAAGEPEAAASPLAVAGWCQAAVDWAYEEGMIGKAFRSGVDCTRSSAVMYIWLALGEESAPASSFSDVPASADYTMAVNWAVANGVTDGTGGNQFSPDRTCTREEIVTFLYRAKDKLAPEDPKSEDDVPAQPEDPQTAAWTLPNGKPATEANIQEILYGFRSEYPEGMPWTNANTYFSQALRILGGGCEAFALICSDAVFANLPVSRLHSDFDAIRVGDIIRVNHDTHAVIVLEKRADSVIVAEGNYNSSIHWGREIRRQELVSGAFLVRTRYPAP